MPTGIYERKPKPYPDPMPRFWKNVEKTATCWLWTGSRYPDGYGQFWYKGRNVRAPRFIYEQLHGPLPPGTFVCHRCDVPLCVRDDHLFAGTVTDNVRDSIAKGRWMTKRREAANPLRVCRGVKNGCAKLTEEQVREIRAAYKPRRIGGRWDPGGGPSLVALGKRYGLTKYAVWSIIKRLTWKHIP